MNCFIQQAGTNHQLRVRDDNRLIFYGSPGDKFCPIWNDNEVTFCLFMPDNKCWIGTTESHWKSCRLFMTTKEEEKAMFWVHRWDKDGSISLCYGRNSWDFPHVLEEHTLGGISPLLLQFYQ